MHPDDGAQVERIDVLVLDFDTYFMQNPTARVLQQVHEKDVEVCREKVGGPSS